MALSYAVPVILLLLFNIAYTRDVRSGGDPQTFLLGREVSEAESWVVGAVMLVGFLTVVLASRWLFKYGAALRKLDAIELIKNDPRAPVLYLRSFDDDAVPDYTGSMTPLGARLTVEMQLAKVFMGMGPVVSIGRPGERLPELGTNRFYVSDDDWQQAVLYFLDRAAGVIIVVGRSTGVTWEITTALRNVPLSRLLFVFPYLLARENRTLGKELRESGQEGPPTLAASCSLNFEKNGKHVTVLFVACLIIYLRPSCHWIWDLVPSWTLQKPVPHI